MYRLLLPIFLISVLILSCSDSNENEALRSVSCDFIDFKYYKAEKHNLGQLSTNFILIGIDRMHTDDEIRQFISTANQIDQDYLFTIHEAAQYKFKEIPLKLSSSKTCEEITQLINELEQDNIVAYAHYTMQTNDCNNAIWEPMGSLCINTYGSSFYVKVIDENDLSDLQQMITDTKTELVKQNQFMPHWFELRATKSSNGKALEMANHFFESGLFEACDPGISKYAVE